MSEPNYVILDGDENRRLAIYRQMASSRSVIPIAAVDDLGSAWPKSAWFLVHDTDGLLAELQAAFAHHRCFHPIVVYSDHLDTDRIVTAIYNGAMNYVLWPFGLEQIELANARIESIANRRCSQAMERIDVRNRIDTMTQREREVILGVREGLSNKEIARDLSISPRTVEIHRANAFAKLGAKNTADATRMLGRAEDADTPILEAG